MLALLIVADRFDEQSDRSFARQDDRDAQHSQAQQNRERQPEKASVADIGKARIGERDNLAARDQLRDTAAGDHQDKRCDDRLHVEAPTSKTVPGARKKCHAERRRDDHRKGNSVDVDQLRRHRAGNRHHRAHRQIHAARRDDQRHAQRQQHHL